VITNMIQLAWICDWQTFVGPVMNLQVPWIYSSHSICQVRGSWIGIVTGPRAGQSGFKSRQRQRFSPPPRPDQLRSHLASYLTSTENSFPSGEAAGAWS
jgi:membrane-associated phospholipid phosphatase